MTKKNYLEEAFVRFRTSGWFVITVVATIAFWLIWNNIPGLPHFDDPAVFGHLNLLLSIEATVATVLIMRDSERSRLREMNILAGIQTSLSALSQIGRDLDEIGENVEEIGENVEELGEDIDELGAAENANH